MCVPHTHVRARLHAEATQAGASALPVEGHRELLAEENRRGAFGLKLALCQSRGFGKLRPEAPPRFSPTAADRLHHHGNESKTLLAAQGARVLVRELKVLIPSK